MVGPTRTRDAERPFPRSSPVLITYNAAIGGNFCQMASYPINEYRFPFHFPNNFGHLQHLHPASAWSIVSTIKLVIPIVLFRTSSGLRRTYSSSPHGPSRRQADCFGCHPLQCTNSAMPNPVNYPSLLLSNLSIFNYIHFLSTRNQTTNLTEETVVSVYSAPQPKVPMYTNYRHLF
jgi:hypothetical protein